MSIKSVILIVEDDTILRETLAYNLRQEGYQVEVAPDGATALAVAERAMPALVVLDVMLPDMDGFAICRRLRSRSAVPIIMLTARTEEVDRVVGLELGADDYVTKPFSLRELLARVKAVLRRGQAESQSAAVPGNVIEAGGIRLDLARRQAWVREQPVELTGKQFDVLATLIQHRGLVLTRDVLLDRVWGLGYVGETRTVDVHVRWLREKIEQDPSDPVLIETVRGVGYRFVG